MKPLREAGRSAIIAGLPTSHRYAVTAGRCVFAARLTHPSHGLEAGDTLLAHEALEPDFALVRLIPAAFLTMLELDQAHVLEYLTEPLFPQEVTRLLEAHFLTVRRRHRTHLAILP